MWKLSADCHIKVMTRWVKRMSQLSRFPDRREVTVYSNSLGANFGLKQMTKTFLVSTTGVVPSCVSWHSQVILRAFILLPLRLLPALQLRLHSFRFYIWSGCSTRKTIRQFSLHGGKKIFRFFPLNHQINPLKWK